MSAPRFEVLRTAASGARLGRLTLAHGVVETPAFMPVATHGSVKGITPAQLDEVGATIVLSNAYHLAQRPGVEVVTALGGLHALMGWSRPILTDSGGFQVMSLAGLVRVDDDGVRYRSHVDGREGFLRPEDAVAVQEALGVDVAMSLDECVSASASPAEVARAVARTSAWAARGLAARRRGDMALFGIVQGGFDPSLRAESAAALLALPFDATPDRGEPQGRPASPRDGRPAARRRARADEMGTPRDLISFAGLSTASSIVPRPATVRKGYSSCGEALPVMPGARDPRPLDESCTCYACTHFSRGALRHLALAKEMLAAQLATLHNLHFYLRLMREIRADLAAGTFAARACEAAGTWA